MHQQLEKEIMPISMDEHKPCPECGSRVFLDDKRGELVCSNCGLVVEEAVIDAYPQLSEDQKVEREPTQDKIYPQRIFGSKDAHGNPVDQQKSSVLRKTAEHFNLAPRDRQRLRIARDINQLCSIYELPQEIADRAAYIYRKTVESKVIMKPSMRCLTIASTILACRERKVFVDVWKMCNSALERRSVLRYCHAMTRTLKLETYVSDAENYVVKFISDLGESLAVEQEALRIVRIYEKANANPRCLAAAATSLACLNLGVKKTQREVKEIASVSEVTIRTWITILKRLPGVSGKIEPVADKIDLDKIRD